MLVDEMVRDMWQDGWSGRLILGFVVVLVVIIALVIWASVKEDRGWEVFKAAHHCKPVAQIKGSTSTGVGINPSGKGGPVIIVTVEPDKTGWLCDDGMTYYR